MPKGHSGLYLVRRHWCRAPVSAKVSLATLKVADKAGNAADAAPRDDGLAAAASNAPP
jgi:hypothetical protein